MAAHERFQRSLEKGETKAIPKSENNDTIDVDVDEGDVTKQGDDGQ
jgi:hypothetical protein